VISHTQKINHVAELLIRLNYAYLIGEGGVRVSRMVAWRNYSSSRLILMTFIQYNKPKIEVKYTL